MKNPLFVILFQSALLFGCANKGNLVCGSTNWHEIGRQAGREGRAMPEVRQIQAACTSAPEAADMITSGYNLGLEDYCTSVNSFTMGRLGMGVPQHCDGDLMPHLMKAYERGERYRELENLNRELRVELEEVGNLSEKSELLKRRAEITHELSTLLK